MNGLPAIQATQSLINIEDYAMGINSLIRQVELIQQAMKSVMKEGEHYGKIPGTDKPTLLKPGAEKLCLMFRFKQDYSIIREVRDQDFIAYTVECKLTHYPTGTLIASGIGSCNSRETKYFYRHVYEPTDALVPKEYWSARNAGNNKEMKRILGKDGRPYKTEEGKWVIAVSAKVKNDNPWDLDNTLVKMACKRALVAATLNGTAASDIFTQDLEELLEKETPEPEPEPETPLFNLDEFLAQLPNEIDKPKFKVFLEQSAKFSKKPIEHTIKIAVNDFAETARSFERWCKKKDAESQGTKEAPKKGRGRPKTNEEPAKQDEGQAEESIDAKLANAKKNLTRTFKKAALYLGYVAHMDDDLDIASLTDEQKQALHARINTEIDKEAY